MRHVRGVGDGYARRGQSEAIVAYEWIIEGLETTWSSIDQLCQPLSPSQYDVATACDGWSVRDVLSHLVGFERMLQGEPVPTLEFTMPTYVRNVVGEINEQFVEARRSTPGDEVRRELKQVCARSIDRLRSLSDQQWEEVGWSPEGDVPQHRFQETRLLDSWIHLQDLRDALLQPQDDHGVGEEIVVNRFEGALAYVVGKRAGAPDGTTVRINVTGRLARTILIDVSGGRAHAVSVVEGTPTVEITTPVALFWRRAAGRISAPSFLNASATDVRGDRDLATRIAEGMAVMI